MSNLTNCRVCLAECERPANDITGKAKHCCDKVCRAFYWLHSKKPDKQIQRLWDSGIADQWAMHMFIYGRPYAFPV